MHETEDSRSISQNKTCICSSSIYPPSVLYPQENALYYTREVLQIFVFTAILRGIRAGITCIERKIVVRFDTRDKNPQNVRDPAHGYQF